MTDEKLSKLSWRVKVMTDLVDDIKDTDEMCILICSLIDIWSKKNGECSYALSRLIDSTERERIKKNGM